MQQQQINAHKQNMFGQISNRGPEFESGGVSNKGFIQIQEQETTTTQTYTNVTNQQQMVTADGNDDDNFWKELLSTMGGNFMSDLCGDDP